MPVPGFKKIPVPASPAIHTVEHEYDIGKVLQAAIEHRSPDGMEGEIHQEFVARMSPQRREQAQGIRIPLSLIGKSHGTVTSPNNTLSGLTGEDWKDALFTQTGDAILPELFTRKVGVTFITSSEELVKIPLQTGPLEAGWVERDKPMHRSKNAIFTTREMSPKIDSLLCMFERSAVYASHPGAGAQSYLLGRIGQVVTSSIDQTILTGNTLNGPQEGILANATAGTDVTIANPVLEFEKNRVDLLGYMKKDSDETMQAILNPTAASFLRTVPAWSSSTFAALSQGVIGNTGVRESVQMPLTGTGATSKGTCVMGDFSEVVVCVWDSIGLDLNPYSEAAWEKGAIDARLFVEADCIIRDPKKLLKFQVVAGK